MAEDKNKRNENENGGSRIPQKSVLTIRFLVGCYLLYTDYSLIEGVRSREGGERIVIIAFMILFLVAGGFLIIRSGTLLWEDWKREREGGSQRTTPGSFYVRPEKEGESDTVRLEAEDEPDPVEPEAEVGAASEGSETTESGETG